MSSKQVSRAILEQKNAALEKENHYLKGLLVEFNRQITGKKSERFIPLPGMSLFDDIIPPDAMAPDDEELPKDDKSNADKKPRKKPKRKPLPAHFKREVVRIDPDHIDTSNMIHIGDAVTEKVEYIKASYIVIQYRRGKFKDAQGKIHIADLKDPFPKSVAGSSLVSTLLVRKYEDHLPITRQLRIMKREGLELPKSTALNIAKTGIEYLRPVYDVLIKSILAQDYIQVDETSLGVIDKQEHRVKNRCMMVMLAVETKLVGFKFTGSKTKEMIWNAIHGFEGFLQTDGNVSYEYAELLPNVDLLNCNAHARRNLEKLEKLGDQNAAKALLLYQRMYMLERKAKEQGLQDDDLRDFRLERSAPVLNRLKALLEENRNADDPTDEFTKAADYILKRWSRLTKFLQQGRFHPDTNMLERQIRDLVIGRKNYLFCLHDVSADRTGIIYSLSRTARLHGIPFQNWLVEYFQRIIDHPINRIHELLPTKDFVFLHSPDPRLSESHSSF